MDLVLEIILKLFLISLFKQEMQIEL